MDEERGKDSGVRLALLLAALAVGAFTAVVGFGVSRGILQLMGADQLVQVVGGAATAVVGFVAPLAASADIRQRRG